LADAALDRGRIRRVLHHLAACCGARLCQPGWRL